MPENPLNFIKVLKEDNSRIEKFLKEFSEIAKQAPSYPYPVKDYGEDALTTDVSEL